MDLFEALAARLSYREAYTGAPVPRADLVRIVTAGVQAPSAKNLQTTSFVIVDEPRLVAAIAEIVPIQAGIASAPAFIVCCNDIAADPSYAGFSYLFEDCAAATENMLLAITALGYASVWLDGVLRIEQRAERIGELLGLPSGKIVRILLPVGVPSVTVPRREKLPFEARVSFNGWQMAP